MSNIYPRPYWKIYMRADCYSVRLLKDVARDAMKQPALSRVRDLSERFGPCDIEDARTEQEYFRRILSYDGRGKSFDKAIKDLLNFYAALESRNNNTEVK